MQAKCVPAGCRPKEAFVFRLARCRMPGPRDPGKMRPWQPAVLRCQASVDADRSLVHEAVSCGSCRSGRLYFAASRNCFVASVKTGLMLMFGVSGV